MENNSNEVKYAGFWVRLLAFVIDAVLMGIPMKIIDSVLDRDGWFGIILALILFWLYYGYSLYRWRATIGKKIVGIEVLNYDLTPVSLKKASLRFIYSLITYSLLFSPSLVFVAFAWLEGSFTYIGFILFLIPIIMMFFTEKRQVLHDYFAKTVVVDVASMLKDTPRGTSVEEFNTEKDVRVEKIDGRHDNTKNVSIIGFVRTIGIIIVVGFSAYYLYVFSITAFVFGSLAKHKQKSYDNSFHIKYQTSDYNDSKIMFYNNELEKYSKEFIESESMYDIFEADVKKDLVLGCIQYFIRRKNKEIWIEEGSKFRKNARNKYASTEEKIKKAKRNSNYMGKHFYTFDLNIVNHVVDDVTKVWSDKNESVCKNKLSANELYEVFIENYIPRFDNENIHSEFGSKPQERDLNWYKILKEKRKDVFQKILQEKERIKEEEKRVQEERIENRRKRIEHKRLENAKREKDNNEALVRLKEIFFVEKKNSQEIDILFTKVTNIDLWIDGSHQGNLLYQAVKNNDMIASKILLDYGASTVKTSEIIHLALSDSTEVELFELILVYYLNPKNHRNINMLLINAIEQNSSDKKIKIILEYITEVSKEYLYVVKSAIKSCRDSKFIRLLLSKEERLKQNERLFSLLHKTSYSCPNKKEIEVLFEFKKEHKVVEDKSLKSKFIRFEK